MKSKKVVVYGGEENKRAIEKIIAKKKGTIKEGPCLYCGADNGMKYLGKYFACAECGRTISEDGYYVWDEGCDGPEPEGGNNERSTKPGPIRRFFNGRGTTEEPLIRGKSKG